MFSFYQLAIMLGLLTQPLHLQLPSNSKRPQHVLVVPSTAFHSTGGHLGRCNKLLDFVASYVLVVSSSSDIVECICVLGRGFKTCIGST